MSIDSSDKSFCVGDTVWCVPHHGADIQCGAVTDVINGIGGQVIALVVDGTWVSFHGCTVRKDRAEAIRSAIAEVERHKARLEERLAKTNKYLDECLARIRGAA